MKKINYTFIYKYKLFSQTKYKKRSICYNIEKLSSDDFLGRESERRRKKAAKHIKIFIASEFQK